MLDDDRVWKEYDYLFRLEQEMNKTRWTVFTAFLSVSFIICGLVLKEMVALGPLVGKGGMVFGWLIFMAGFYHYWWFHRRAHALRDQLCELEARLFIRVFEIRVRRPRLAGVRLYYHWAIDILAVAYTALMIVILVSK